MQSRLEVRTRFDVSRDQHEIQVISVRSASVAFKVIQSPDASCYSGLAQHFHANLYIFSLLISINMRFPLFLIYSFDNYDMKSSKRHVVLLSLIFLLK